MHGRWHSPASFRREAWREASSWIALLGFGLCAWLFDPAVLAAIGERLDAVTTLASRIGLAIASALLLARRSRGERDEEETRRC